MDLEPCFKVHNLVVIQINNTKLGQMTTLNVIFYMVVSIDHFTVVSLVTWPWIVSKAGVDLVLIETSLLFICKPCCSYALVMGLPQGLDPGPTWGIVKWAEQS